MCCLDGCSIAFVLSLVDDATCLLLISCIVHLRSILRKLGKSLLS